MRDHETDDLISRKAAVDVIDKIFPADPMRNDYTQGITCGAALATEYIKQLPSAQPDVPDTNVGDTISRQAAMEEISKQQTYKMFEGEDTLYLDANDVGSVLASLSSAQPEIIHCRDCKHWREGDAYSYCQKLFNCGVLDVYDYMRAEDDFCSEAERRTDG